MPSIQVQFKLSFLHGFHDAIAYPHLFSNNVIVYPEDGVLFYAAME
jgi:hypothetical protein